MTLPEEFKDRMKNLPDFDFDEFIKSYDKPAFRGLRVNKLKCSTEHFKEIFPFELKGIPFSIDGFYIGDEISGKHPWHHAGVFYMQEPSAMSAVTALDVKPGMKVLDLCAAPGGKSTQIAACLMGQGLLISNEIVSSRASILLSNIERCGVRNAVVTCDAPAKICERLEGFFDRVLVDAPCSGEGMFRREPAASREWTEASEAACAKRQSAILETASRAVAENGILVYSTCTFSSGENEGVVDAFLKSHNDFRIEAIDADFGRSGRPDWANASPELALSRRVFPMDGGEGHFVARLRRISGGLPSYSKSTLKPADKETTAMFNDFFTSQFDENIYGTVFQNKEKVFILPEGLPELRGIGILRTGVFAGNIKGKRFEPSHALYMAADSNKTLNTADFTLSDSRLTAFLHGETVEAPKECVKGYVSVKSQGFVTGFGKISEGILKNHYPKGLRNL